MNINRTLARADAGPTNDYAQGAGNPEGAQIKKSHQHYTAIRGRISGVIVCLAVWGLIPAGLATWLIQRGGLRHE